MTIWDQLDELFKLSTKSPFNRWSQAVGNAYVGSGGRPFSIPRAPDRTPSRNAGNFLREPMNAIGRASGIANDLATRYGPRRPSIEDILSRLESLQDPSRYMADPDMLELQARSSAAQQYDPVISRLRQQMGLAEQRANRGREAIGSMFGQLSSQLSGEIPGIENMYEGTKTGTAEQYAALKNNINNQYAQSQADQEAMMKRLNIQAAAPDVMEEQVRDQNYFANLASTEGQTQQAALGQEQRGAVEYTRRGSQLALTEGSQRQSDLIAALQDLLAQYEGEIGATESAKQNAYMSALAELQGEQQNMAFERSQRDFNNYIKVLNVARMLQGENDEFDGVKRPTDVTDFALSQGLAPQSAQKIQSAFMNAISGDEMILAGIDSNFGQALSKEALAARVVEQGKRAGLSPQEINALQYAALEYFGRR